MSLSEIGAEAANSTSDDGGSGGSDVVDYERFDLSNMDFVKPHPGTTAVAGSSVALRYVPPAPDNNGQYDDNDRGWAGLIINDPYIPDDDEFDSIGIFKSNKEVGDDYKVVNKDHDSVDVYPSGVSVGNMFESEEIDEFDTDQIILKLSTSAGRSAIRTLDVKGLANADMLRDDNGQIQLNENGYPESNGGLIETHPGNDDDNYTHPRYARDPQLRPDVEGRDVVIMIQHLAEVKDDYNGNAHWATVLADVDDDRREELAQEYAENNYFDADEPEAFIHDVNGVEMIRLSPTMDFEPDENLVRATQWYEWRWVPEDELDELRKAQGFE